MTIRRGRFGARVLALALTVALGAPVTHAANADAEALLLTHVPSSIAAGCTSEEPADAGRMAQVRCQPGGVVGEVTYILFESNTAMDASYDAHLTSFPDAVGDDCAAGPSEGAYAVEGAEVGRLFCEVLDGRVFFEWTDERFAILTVAFGVSADFAGLFNWWVAEAGPVEAGATPPPSATPGAPGTAPASEPAATGEPDPTGPKVPVLPFSRLTGASIHQILFATGFDRFRSTPIGISDAFVIGTPTIMALIAWDIIEIGAELDVKLFRDDRLVTQYSLSPSRAHPRYRNVDTDSGFAIPFTPEGGFSAGLYTVQLDYHGIPEQVASFEVNETGDGVPLPGNLSAGAPGTAPDLGPVPYADPTTVLVVTRSSILRAQMGPDVDAVLAAAAGVGTVHDLDVELGSASEPATPEASSAIVRGLLQAGGYRYLLILGNDDAVPMGHVDLPDSVDFSDEMAGEGIPGDYIVSDDPYGDLDGDPLGVPDLAVARIPTSDDAALMLTQLSEVQPGPVNAFSLVNEVRRSYADAPLGIINGITPVTLYYAPPTDTAEVPETNQAAARFVYVLLHGSGSKTDTWFGDIQSWRPLNPTDPLTEYITVDHGYSEGITVATAGAPGAIVNIGACFGAYTLDTPYGDTHKTRDNSLALKYLASGSRAFIADTHISISTNSEPGQLIKARTGFEILLWQEIQAGATPIDAFLRAKQLMAQLITAQYADGDGDGFADDPLDGELNYLTIHEMVYLGRP